ncbi:hypothetical protein Droror1_Dr00025868 [Drosera rotundifolia]
MKQDRTANLTRGTPSRKHRKDFIKLRWHSCHCSFHSCVVFEAAATQTAAEAEDSGGGGSGSGSGSGEEEEKEEERGRRSAVFEAGEKRLRGRALMTWPIMERPDHVNPRRGRGELSRNSRGGIVKGIGRGAPDDSGDGEEVDERREEDDRAAGGGGLVERKMKEGEREGILRGIRGIGIADLVSVWWSGGVSVASDERLREILLRSRWVKCEGGLEILSRRGVVDSGVSSPMC